MRSSVVLTRSKGGQRRSASGDVAELTRPDGDAAGQAASTRIAAHRTDGRCAVVGDSLKAMLARHAGAGGDEVDTTELFVQHSCFVAGEGAVAAAQPVMAAPEPAAQPACRTRSSCCKRYRALSTTMAPTSGQRVVELRVGPLNDPAVADNLAELFKEITDLGTIEALPDHPSLAGVRRFKVTTATAESELLDLFTFHGRVNKWLSSLEAPRLPRNRLPPWRLLLRLRQMPVLASLMMPRAHPAASQTAPQTAAPAAAAPAEKESGYGFFDDAPGAPAAKAAEAAAATPAPVAAKPAAASLLPHRRKSLRQRRWKLPPSVCRWKRSTSSSTWWANW